MKIRATFVKDGKWWVVSQFEFSLTLTLSQRERVQHFPPP